MKTQAIGKGNPQVDRRRNVPGRQLDSRPRCSHPVQRGGLRVLGGDVPKKNMKLIDYLTHSDILRMSHS